MASYHLWHHPALDGAPALATTPLSIPTIDPVAGPPTEVKLFQSLRNDMDQLRSDGARQGDRRRGGARRGQQHRRKQLWALKVGKESDHKVLFTGSTTRANGSPSRCRSWWRSS